MRNLTDFCDNIHGTPFTMTAGGYASLKGLTKVPEFNGRIVRLIRQNEDNPSRWEVEILNAPKKRLAALAGNLQPINLTDSRATDYKTPVETAAVIDDDSFLDSFDNLLVDATGDIPLLIHGFNRQNCSDIPGEVSDLIFTLFDCTDFYHLRQMEGALHVSACWLCVYRYCVQRAARRKHPRGSIKSGGSRRCPRCMTETINETRYCSNSSPKSRWASASS